MLLPLLNGSPLLWLEVQGGPSFPHLLKLSRISREILVRHFLVTTLSPVTIHCSIHAVNQVRCGGASEAAMQVLYTVGSSIHRFRILPLQRCRISIILFHLTLPHAKPRTRTCPKHEEMVPPSGDQYKLQSRLMICVSQARRGRSGCGVPTRIRMIHRTSSTSVGGYGDTRLS